MQLLLIYFLVIMVLKHANSAFEKDFRDLSLLCKNGWELNVYLTSGEGSSDKFVAMLASDKDVNCSLKFKTKSNLFIMIVIEFPKQISHKKVCFSSQNSSVTISNSVNNEACEDKGTKPLHKFMSVGEASIHLFSEDYVNTVKMIATSMWKCSKNCNSNETLCIYDGKKFCMSHTTVCDGYSNCGVPHSFDEDKEKCSAKKLSIFLILCTIIMIILTFGLAISCIMSILPRKKKTFVQDFNQAEALFDYDGVINAKISFKKLYPKTY